MSDFRLVYSRPDGGVSVVIPAAGVTEQEAALSVPDGISYTRMAVGAIPADRTFRDAWVLAGGAVDHDVEKVKEIAHEKRRAARAEEFKPYDEIIALQIPGKAGQEAEAERAKIRDKYSAIQSEIDAAATVEEVKAALEAMA